MKVLGPAKFDTMPNIARNPESGVYSGERRRDSRVRLLSVAYFYLSEEIRGPIVNICEGGLGVRAELSEGQNLQQITFSLPDSAQPIVCDAKVSWVDELKGRAGIRFVDLPEEARERIRNWVSSKTNKAPAPTNGEHAGLVADFSRPRRSQDAFNLDSFFPPESTLTLKTRTRQALSGNGFRNYAQSRWVARDDASERPVEKTPAEEVAAESPATLLAAPTEPFDASHATQFSELARSKWDGLAETAAFSAALDKPSGDAPLEAEAPDSIPMMIAEPKADAQAEILAQAEPATPVSQAFPDRVPMAETKVYTEPEKRTREDWQVPFQVTSRPAKTSWTSVSPAIPPVPKKRTMAPFVTATAGFGLGLALCAVVIVGPSRIAEMGSNLLLQSEKVWASKPEATAPADSSQELSSGNERHGSAAALPASASQITPRGSSAEPNETGASADRGGRTASTARDAEDVGRTEPQTQAEDAEAANATRVPRNPTPGNQILNDVKPAESVQAGTLPTPRMSPPVTKSPQPQPAPDRNPVAVASQAGAEAQKIPSGTVASNSQFTSVHMPAEPGAAKPQLSGVLQIGQVTVGPGPVYPIAAAQAHIEGTVVLHATVGTDGNVEKVEPVSGAPELITAAMTAIHSWHYAPTMIASEAVESEHTITFAFHLTD